ncbi:hypothetical protein KSD_17220 [Ktedonobacter sp. SOSP1-85]|uniref:toll/interleukin-1 receptor domain-containing protein n=1 Tax=Ktedonobacter sp. SOSP1-85 TaxID=2778367 RepID=UPI0019161A57|nr:toll/interleukin-1 receptor domain-containing protein [Ktedonobacter sp. SOSP1-85]GHO73951.1 hypothetical protein KSD_17220 [Ktedonobacter sp. SOSP1-85]
MPTKIFFCYAREDEQLLKELKAHLRPLEREGLIDIWYDADISAGMEWEVAIKRELDSAQIILLLISSDFMDSEYCYSTEMKRAIERHKRGEARVIPIILRHVSWEGILGELQALPKDALPVTDLGWHNRDKAFLSVANDIRKVVKEISQRSSQEEITSLVEINSNKPVPNRIADQSKIADPDILRQEFHEAMINLYRETMKAIGYRATQFYHMVNEEGGVETAHRLLAKEPTDGFTKLWEKKRLDLSVEALVLKPQFASLFDENEREMARRRLKDFRYKAPWDN